LCQERTSSMLPLEGRSYGMRESGPRILAFGVEDAEVELGAVAAGLIFPWSDGG
jgi:hypothetical protein